MSRNRRILIAGPAWVGDMVMAQSLCTSLKQREPECVLDMLAPSWSIPLIERIPEVNRGVDLPTRHGELGWNKRRALGRSLRDSAYDQAIVLPRNAKASLVPWFARVPVRTGFRGEFRYGLINDMRRLDKALLPQTVQRYVALGQSTDAPWPPSIPYPSLHIDRDNRTDLFARFGLDENKSYIALLPGAEFGPSKQWPARHFGVLAQRLANAGITPLIFGSGKERELGETIADYARPDVVNLCGQTRLVDVVDLLAGCDAAVSNDSGLMHVACSVGIPVTVMYGSSSPLFTPPLSAKATILDLELDCSPCFERECPLGHTRCLTEISPEMVWQTLAQQLPTVVK